MFLRELEIELEDETRTVKLDQRYEGDTGVVVWDAAIVLAKYLETNTALVKGKQMVELVWQVENVISRAFIAPGWN